MTGDASEYFWHIFWWFLSKIIGSLQTLMTPMTNDSNNSIDANDSNDSFSHLKMCLKIFLKLCLEIKKCLKIHLKTCLKTCLMTYWKTYLKTHLKTWLEMHLNIFGTFSDDFWARLLAVFRGVSRPVFSWVSRHVWKQKVRIIYFFHTQYLIHIEIYLNTFANISWKIGRQFQGLSDLKNTEDMS